MNVSYLITKELTEHTVTTDVFSELANEHRTLFFGEGVDGNSSAAVVAMLMYLHAKDKTAPISIWLNNPGGEIYSGNAILDVINLIKADGGIIETVCCGLCASYGAVLLAAGSKGHRKALANSTIMIHQPLTGAGSHTQVTDINIIAKESQRLKVLLANHFAQVSGKKLEEVIEDCERDHWLTPEECLPGVYGPKGLIDEIVTSL